MDQEALSLIKETLLYDTSVLRYKIFLMKKEQKFHKYAELTKQMNDLIEGRGKQRFGQKVRFFANSESVKYLDWKAIPMLKKYITRFGDIKPRSYTGNSISRQKKLRRIIIRGRELGLLEYIRQ
ncbi:MAG: 30S ribosomal protein S18 [bacterium]|nr:30S ribosomal protein S18 [bacterium]